MVVSYQEGFCLSKDCILSSDWLIYSPSSAATISALCVVPFLLYIGIRVRNSDKEGHIYDAIALLMLFLSSFIRAFIKPELNNATALYRASIYFNYASAIWFSMLNTLPYSVIKSVKRKSEIFHAKEHESKRFSIIIHTLLLCIMISAVAIMFRTASVGRIDPSRHIIQFVVFGIAILALVTIVFTVFIAYIGINRNWHILSATLARSLLLLMWALFMACRLYLPLDSPARDSELLFYLFNIVPLLLMSVLPSSLSVFHDIDEPDSVV